jgi:hypothetical protein
MFSRSAMGTENSTYPEIFDCVCPKIEVSLTGKADFYYSTPIFGFGNHYMFTNILKEQNS